MTTMKTIPSWRLRQEARATINSYRWCLAMAERYHRDWPNGSPHNADPAGDVRRARHDLAVILRAARNPSPAARAAWNGEEYQAVSA
jgi:hypothetical protein